jgi:hypothetical protein
MELKAIEWDGGYWIQLFQDIEKWQAVVNMVMNIEMRWLYELFPSSVASKLIKLIH